MPPIATTISVKPKMLVVSGDGTFIRRLRETLGGQLELIAITSVALALQEVADKALLFLIAVVDGMINSDTTIPVIGELRTAAPELTILGTSDDELYELQFILVQAGCTRWVSKGKAVSEVLAALTPK